ncbi:MAG: hypothetical protein K2M44_04650 [Clostridia bacterium]|nr:hypothetical protein [Clostridia bacterium]
MNGKQSIIDKIIRDAELGAEANVAAARKKADAVIAQAVADADAMRAEKLSDKSEQTNELIRRRRSVALLDKKRALSAYKSELTAAVFDDAIDAFKSDKKRYKSYVEELLKSNAEDGDVVIASKYDESVVTSAMVSRVAKSLKIKLALSDKAGDFKGGLILSGVNYDKNLTLDDTVRRIRECSETQVAKILFKEN